MRTLRLLSIAASVTPSLTTPMCAGLGGEARRDYDELMTTAADAKEEGDEELQLALLEQAASSHYATVTLPGKREGGREGGACCRCDCCRSLRV